MAAPVDVHLTYRYETVPHGIIPDKDVRLSVLRSDDPAFLASLMELWTRLTTEADLPVERNISNQLPMCYIYEEGLALARYLHYGYTFDISGALIGKTLFGDVNHVKESLMWQDDTLPLDKFIRIMNKELRGVRLIVD